jgi:hypothetical protein
LDEGVYLDECGYLINEAVIDLAMVVPCATDEGS